MRIDTPLPRLLLAVTLSLFSVGCKNRTTVVNQAAQPAAPTSFNSQTNGSPAAPGTSDPFGLTSNTGDPDDTDPADLETDEALDTEAAERPDDGAETIVDLTPDAEAATDEEEEPAPTDVDEETEPATEEPEETEPEIMLADADADADADAAAAAAADADAAAGPPAEFAALSDRVDAEIAALEARPRVFLHTKRRRDRETPSQRASRDAEVEARRELARLRSLRADIDNLSVDPPEVFLPTKRRRDRESPAQRAARDAEVARRATLRRLREAQGEYAAD